MFGYLTRVWVNNEEWVLRVAVIVIFATPFVMGAIAAYNTHLQPFGVFD